MRISFALPCYRSENTIGQVMDEIFEIMGTHQEHTFEIIAVNDCSPDSTIDVLKRYSETDHRVKVIDLAINGGKHAALMAAFHYVTGDVTVTLDDDGQCPLDYLWELLKPIEQGYDVSMAKYPKKKQNFLKNLGSKANDLMTRIMLSKPKSLVFSNFVARKRFVVEEIIKYENPYPYMEGLILRVTRNIALVEMEERSRVSGTSGYTFSKSISLWLNGCTAFSIIPLRLASFIGVVFSMGGFISAVTVIVRKLINPHIVAGYASTMAIILFVGGLLMMMLGMLGEYVGRIYISLNKSPQYVIRDKINL